MEEHYYSHKPQPLFQGDDSYYLGVELEVEAPDDEAKAKGLGLRRRPRGLYAKHDSSLNKYGWELVTHPIARNLWLAPKVKAGAAKRFFDLVGELRGLKYNSHDGGRCGLHVHVSRTAFGNRDEVNYHHIHPEGCEIHDCLANQHFYWFARLVNGELFKRISQRTESKLASYARQLRILRKNFHEAGYSHYTALNPTRNTVEVRIFRGNMREDRIRKALEAVIGAVEWAREFKHPAFHSPFTIELREVDADREFINHVIKNKRTYRHLLAYLKEIGLVAGRAVKPAVPEDVGPVPAPAMTSVSAPVEAPEPQPQGIIGVGNRVQTADADMLLAALHAVRDGTPTPPFLWTETGHHSIDILPLHNRQDANIGFQRRWEPLVTTPAIPPQEDEPPAATQDQALASLRW